MKLWSEDQLTEVLERADQDEAIFAEADLIRRQCVGDEVHLRGIIEFSNCCQQNCLYCGLRRDNKKLKRYRLTEEEIVAMATRASELGYRTVVLQSGEDVAYSDAMICRIVEKVKKLDLAITLSIGEKTFAQYKAYREAGADRYLLRIETTNKELYEALDPGMSFENRLECLSILRDLGYEAGTGGMVGLPGQTARSIARDLLFYQEFKAPMVGIGPFIPHPDTPLKDEVGGTFLQSLKVLALARILLPYANLPATTALETLSPNGRVIGLKHGANVVMPNVTEGAYRQWYALYPGKVCINDTPGQCRSCMGGKIASIGRSVAKDYGFCRVQSV